MFEKVEAFHRPGNIREALRLLHSGKGRARIVAGATDVAVENDRSIRILIDITQAGLSYIRKVGTTCRIGATTTLAELEASLLIVGLGGGILARASAACGSVQIRNRATLGGNLSNASPAADTVTALLALDAEVTVAGAGRRRTVPLGKLYTDPGLALLRQGLLTEVVIPAPPRGSRWSFHKLGRTQLDIALVNVAAGLQLDSRGRVKWARIALGAVAPTPIRAIGAEELLVGNTIGDAVLEEVTDEVARTIAPLTDVRASAEYRRTMSRVLTRRALEECAAASMGCTL